MNMLGMDILLRLQPRLGVLHDIDIGRAVSDPPERSSSIYDCHQWFNVGFGRVLDEDNILAAALVVVVGCRLHLNCRTCSELLQILSGSAGYPVPRIPG